MKILIYFSLLLLALESFGQAIPNEVKKTVVFIYIKNDSSKIVPNGTGFLVGVKDTSSKLDKYTVYLVTAKHIIQKQDKKTIYNEIYLRLNKKDSSSSIIPLSLQTKDGNKNVFIHTDSTVDIAVISTTPNTDIYDYMILPDKYFTSKSDFINLNIQEGTEVFFTGMFMSYIGDKRNYPIVRFGRIALVTDEKIPWDSIKAELYLIESASYGGNSGSPVFFYLGPNRGDGSIHVGPPIIKLAGIMKGFFGEKTPIQVVNTNYIPVSITNVGIAAVIPSYFLKEILFSKELILIRGF